MEGTYFAILPQDIINIIASYLNPIDLINIGVQLNSIHFSKESLEEIDLSADFRLDLELVKIIGKRRCLDRVLTLNLNGIYWIPAASIRQLLKKMSNLKNLLLLNTKMSLLETDVAAYKEFKQLTFLAVNGVNKKLMDSFDNKFPTCDFLIQIGKYFYFRQQASDQNDFSKYNQLVYYISPLGGYQRVTGYSYKEAIHIHSTDWMNVLIKTVTAHFQTNREKLEVCQTRKVVSLSEFPKLFGNPVGTLSNITDIAVVDHLEDRAFNLLSLNAAASFVNLEKLEVDITLNVDTNFLANVFTNCTRLKSVKIRNQKPQLNLFQIKFAKNLKEFSYITNLDFNVDRFFKILLESEVKLVRVYLKLKMNKSMLVGLVDKFFWHNPQLILFVVENKMPKVSRKAVQKVLDTFVKTPKDFYKVLEFSSDEELGIIPLVHYDLTFMKVV